MDLQHFPSEWFWTEFRASFDGVRFGTTLVGMEEAENLSQTKHGSPNAFGRTSRPSVGNLKSRKHMSWVGVLVVSRIPPHEQG